MKPEIHILKLLPIVFQRKMYMHDNNLQVFVKFNQITYHIVQ